MNKKSRLLFFVYGGMLGVLVSFIGSIVFGIGIFAVRAIINLSSRTFSYQNYLVFPIITIPIFIASVIPSILAGISVAMWVYSDVIRATFSIQKSKQKGRAIGFIYGTALCISLITLSNFFSSHSSKISLGQIILESLYVLIAVILSSQGGRWVGEKLAKKWSMS